MDVGSVEEVVENVPGRRRPTPRGAVVSGSAERVMSVEPEHWRRHERTVVVMVMEARGEEIMERVVHVMTVESGTPEEVVVPGKRVVTAEEGAEDLERVHGMEGGMAVEGGRVVTGGGGSSRAPAAVPEAVLAEPIVGGLLVGVAEDLVGLGDFLELLLGVVGLVLVRVKLERHLAVGLFDVIAAGVAVHAQNGVVVFSGHFCLSALFFHDSGSLFLFSLNDYCHAAHCRP